MNEKIGIKEKIKKICTVETAVKNLFTAFLLVSLFNLLVNEGSYTELSFVAGISLVVFFTLLVTIAFALAAIDVLCEKIRFSEWCLLISAVLFSCKLVADAPKGNEYQLFAAVLISLAVIIVYLSGKGLFDIIPKDFDGKIKWGAVAAVSIAVCAFVAAIGVYRYLTFSSPNYDFGIWCNMFHNMKESGLPNTTCERDMLLSHFAVHFSPIYYLMLPVYFVFPYPETLQILQAVVLYSGVIPLCVIAKHKGLSSRTTSVLAAIYAFYPAIAAGTFYDLHENCFLVPLLLWVFCFFEKEKYIPMGVFAVLTLLVKEDAFVYLLVFAVYAFFLKGKKKISLAIAFFAVVYFAAVSGLMKEYGMGVMSGRYENLIYEGNGGLVEVFKNIILNPGYFLTQLFVSKNGDNSKILYLFQLLVPLALIPVATRRISRYILVLPVLINIMTMYQYQPNIKFQYSFGITAFLFYLTALNLSELGSKAKRTMLPIALVASLLMFVLVAGTTYSTYSDRYEKNRVTYQQMEETLENELPDDVSVVCSTMLLPHIADRSEVYEVKYHKENGKYKTDTDYAVFDMRYKEESESAVKYFCNNGYEIYYTDNNLTFLRKK